MLLLIDNFDSFTYNILHAFEKIGQTVVVIRNNIQSADQCLAMKPSYIVIGPGPGNPTQAGISKELIYKAAQSTIPLLGICLGHQALGEVFGGCVMRASSPVHGKQSAVFHDDSYLFKGIPQGFKATRYHSLIIDEKTLPPSLQVTAYLQSGEVMGIRHRDYPLEGIQFHPESIASEGGERLLTNFLNRFI
jgi:anthranilate synthase component II